MQPACTHIEVWTAEPSAIDRPRKLLLTPPPALASLRDVTHPPKRNFLHVQHIVVGLDEPRSLMLTIVGWPASGAMRHPAYQRRRIALPRTWVNKGKGGEGRGHSTMALQVLPVRVGVRFLGLAHR
jgi:hypothetical protein